MERTGKERARIIRLAGIISLAGNMLLASVKLVAAGTVHSLAVLGDGMDSGFDVLISVVTLVTSGIIAKPGDTEHPWGHARAETVATMVLTFVIFFVGSELCISAAKKLISGDYGAEIQAAAVWVSLLSICGKLLLALSQRHLGNLAGSDIVRANAQNMRNDTVLSAAVLAGLLASHLLGIPALDPVAALLVGLWIIKGAVVLFAGLNRELMDGNNDRTLYERLFSAAQGVEGVTNPHHARIRKLGAQWDIVLDIEVPPEMTVHEAHEKAGLVEKAIRKAIPDVYDVMIHVEPAGGGLHQGTETFGLSPQSLCVIASAMRQGIQT